MTVAPLHLPPLTEETLPNGLTLVTARQADLPLIAIRLVLQSGAVRDPAGKSGLAALTGTLLRRGTKKRTGDQIDDAIESIGGLLGVDVGYEGTTLAVTAPSEHTAVALETLADLAANPSFPQGDFAKEQRRELAQIKQGLDDPSGVADRALIEWYYGKDHPFGRPLEGRIASVKTLKRSDLVAFHRETYSPSGAVLYLVGDIDAATAAKLARKAFAKWQGPALTPIDIAQTSPAEGLRILLVDKADATQAQVRIAVPGIARNEPGFHAAAIANTIVGGGFTSRLVDEVRVNRGLSYSVSTRLLALRQTGAILYSTFTRNETVREILDVSFAALKTFHDSGPTEDEVAKAKRYIIGLYPGRVESLESLADALAAARMNGLPFDAITEYRDRVAAVDVHSAAAAARMFPTTASAKIIVVGNAKAIRGQLASLGEVTVKQAKSFE